MRNRRIPPIEDVFWRKVAKAGARECWEWSGRINDAGYGELRHNRILDRAHRISWRLNVGALGQSSCVLHSCDNRKCVNPGHLFLGTRSHNSEDMVSKGRQTKGVDVHCAKLTEAQVVDARQRYAEGNVSYRTLAADFGVGEFAMRMAVKRRTWKHVP